MDFRKIADSYGTPLYIYDFDYITRRYLELKEAFKARKSIVFYALKANSNLSVLKHLRDLGAGCDCVSIGEVKRALFVGVPKYKIIFSGVGKCDAEIKEALLNDILMINLESFEEMLRVESIAKELEKVARISVRVNPNIDAKTHPYISTGLHENKFGVDIQTAKKIYLKAKQSNFLDPVGIHFHIGSQILEIEPFKEASKIVSDLVRSLNALNIELKFFDIGGGLGIDYNGEKTIDPYAYAQAVLENLSGLDVTLACEPGRYLVGNSGYFLTKVLYEKENSHKRFVIVDGAMNDLLRPALYNTFHKVELLESKNRPDSTLLCDVVGPICESGDFFIKDIKLPKTKHDDLIVVHSAGAYGFSMSSNYNSRPRVAEVAYESGKYRLIRQRESFEDLISKEISFLNSEKSE